MTNVVLLNADYSFLMLVDWKRAAKLLAKGKVEIVKASERVVGTVKGVKDFIVPQVLKLIKLIRRIYKNRVPFSKRNVFVRDNFTCQYCGSRTELTIDHVIPVSKGGKSDFENCTTSCRPCNNIKNDRSLHEARMYLKRVPYTPTIMEFMIIKAKNLGIDELLEEIMNNGN